MGRASSNNAWWAPVLARPVVFLAGLVMAVGLMSSTALADTTTTYQYDVLGRLIKVSAPNGQVTTYTYDAAGNRTQFTSTGTPMMTLPLLTGVVIPTH